MRTIVLTGASDGIGAAAAELLAADGRFRPVLVGRSPAKTREVAERIGAEWHTADFERLDEVRELAAVLAERCERIEVLVNNAGGIFPGPVRTVDGFERTFQVNHLAPYLLTRLLMDRLLTGRAAVVSTASRAARLFGRYDPGDIQSLHPFRAPRAYGNAKLANILFARELHERFHARGLNAVAFHPGVVATNFAAGMRGGARAMYHGLLRGALVPPRRGAARLVHFATGRPGSEWRSGRYYEAPGRIGRLPRGAARPQAARLHWERSAQLLGLAP